jgi:signal transduction histidine kinase
MTPDEAFHTQLRRWPSTFGIALACGIFGIAPLWPSAQSLLNLTLSWTLPICLGMAVGTIIPAVAVRRFGFQSAAYFWLNRLETAVFAGGMATLLIVSRDVASVIWVPYAVHLVNAGIGGRERFFNPILFGVTGAAHVAAMAVLRDAGSAVIVLGCHAVLLYAYLMLASRSTLLSQAIRERDELNMRLSTQQLEAERSRIARDLHDSIGADLSTVFWELQKLVASGPPESSNRQAMEGIAARVSESMTELRGVIWALEVERLEWPELVDRIRLRCIELCADRFSCEFQVSGEPGKPLTGEQRQHLARIIQEGVRNAVRHSGGAKLKVNVRCESDTMHFEIEDDGKGLPTDALERKRGGLFNLQARARAMGGHLEIASASPGGRLRFRLKPPNG